MSTLIISEFEVSGSHDCKEQLAPAEIKPTKFNWADDFEDDEEFGSRPEDLLLPSQMTSSSAAQVELKASPQLRDHDSHFYQNTSNSSSDNDLSFNSTEASEPDADDRTSVSSVSDHEDSTVAGRNDATQLYQIDMNDGRIEMSNGNEGIAQYTTSNDHSERAYYSYDVSDDSDFDDGCSDEYDWDPVEYGPLTREDTFFVKLGYGEIAWKNSLTPFFRLGYMYGNY